MPGSSPRTGCMAPSAGTALAPPRTYLAGGVLGERDSLGDYAGVDKGSIKPLSRVWRDRLTILVVASVALATTATYGLAATTTLIKPSGNSSLFMPCTFLPTLCMSVKYKVLNGSPPPIANDGLLPTTVIPSHIPPTDNAAERCSLPGGGGPIGCGGSGDTSQLAFF